MAQHQFQTEVSQLLHLIIHSLYSNREIFLRELVSNASDALDKLKYLTVAEDAYKGLSFEPRIDVSFVKAEEGAGPSRLSISDNGIGMNEQDLIESLGTIARSGTKAFLERLADEARRDSNLIGQFGVGFYSAFMVADRIEVISRKALEEAAWKWSSDGASGFETESAERESQGTEVILYLNAEGEEYANRWSIEDIVKRYSNHVAFPIYLTYDEKEYDDKGKVKSSKSKTERINSGTALWRRPKSELKEEDYREFYQNFDPRSGPDSGEPLFHVHTRAEGTLEYTTLFFIPKKAPFDLYHADYKPGVKLYVKRVFITDDDKDLLPVWLRFVRGIIDSEDLPLNVSREILQQNKVLANIRNASVKKLLSEFKALADRAAAGDAEARDQWETFIGEFNRPLKEGLYQDWGNREALAELVRFKSSVVEGWTSFADYVSRMKGDQKYIYYISGGDERTLRASPLLEAYRARDIEVLIMDSEIDDIVIPGMGRYRKPGENQEELELRAVNRSGADEELGEERDKGAEREARPVIGKIRKALGDRVKDVKLSRRLRDSPSCIVADENDPTMQMAQMLKALGQGAPEVKPILEVNGEHPIVARLKDLEDEEAIADIAGVLLDQALLVEGLKLTDPADFVKRLNRLLARDAAAS
ncbi:MAG: molecular chaperone HtpG [Spirochaetaceae bacterium]|jgi:molecular chaperone HtpG|nr:molecular chaperone HtpG [Spirochaetaceae bacterium]